MIVTLTRPTPFDQDLADGQMVESLVTHYLRHKQGWTIFPAYEKEINTGKGPRLFIGHGNELVSPDLLGFRHNHIVWFEVKSKDTATWSRKKACYQTGIDLRLYKDYKQVQRVTRCPVWLLFLQQNCNVSNAPADAPPCPTGLYGCPVTQPTANDSYGVRPYMVYWNISDLKKLATLEEVIRSL